MLLVVLVVLLTLAVIVVMTPSPQCCVSAMVLQSARERQGFQMMESIVIIQKICIKINRTKNILLDNEIESIFFQTHNAGDGKECKKGYQCILIFCHICLMFCYCSLALSSLLPESIE